MKARQLGSSALVVNTWGQPGATIRQIVSHDAAGEVVELKRNLRVLSAMATLGPLLGLLGTVVGIIQSFDALGGRVGPARGEALAHGISLALVATAFGLAIAIVAVTFYYFFLNRVDILVRELDDRARQVIELVSSESQRLPPGGSPPRPDRLPTAPHESRTIIARPSAIALPIPRSNRRLAKEPSRCSRAASGRRPAGHQHDADGRRDSLPARVLHGRHQVV